MSVVYVGDSVTLGPTPGNSYHEDVVSALKKRCTMSKGSSLFCQIVLTILEFSKQTSYIPIPCSNERVTINIDLTLSDDDEEFQPISIDRHNRAFDDNYESGNDLSNYDDDDNDGDYGVTNNNNRANKKKMSVEEKILSRQLEIKKSRDNFRRSYSKYYNKQIINNLQDVKEEEKIVRDRKDIIESYQKLILDIKKKIKSRKTEKLDKILHEIQKSKQTFLDHNTYLNQEEFNNWMKNEFKPASSSSNVKKIEAKDNHEHAFVSGSGEFESSISEKDFFPLKREEESFTELSKLEKDTEEEIEEKNLEELMSVTEEEILVKHFANTSNDIAEFMSEEVNHFAIELDFDEREVNVSNVTEESDEVKLPSYGAEIVDEINPTYLAVKEEIETLQSLRFDLMKICLFGCSNSESIIEVTCCDEVD